MKHKVTSEKRKRTLHKKNEFFLFISKFFFKNLKNTKDITYQYLFFNLRNFLFKRKKIKTIINFKNRCILAGRPKAVFTHLRISRISFRNLALFGFLAGFRKSSY